VSVRTVEVYEVRCDAGSPRCSMACAYDSMNEAEALRRAKAEGWRTFGTKAYGFRHKCPECVQAKAKLT